MPRLLSELKAIIAIGGLIALFVAVAYFRNGGKAKVVQATIDRFGSYSSDDGNQPTVILRLPGETAREIATNRASILGCRVGDQIWLVKRSHSLIVAPRGCR